MKTQLKPLVIIKRVSFFLLIGVICSLLGYTGYKSYKEVDNLVPDGTIFPEKSWHPRSNITEFYIDLEVNYPPYSTDFPVFMEEDDYFPERSQHVVLSAISQRNRTMLSGEILHLDKKNPTSKKIIFPLMIKYFGFAITAIGALFCSVIIYFLFKDEDDDSSIFEQLKFLAYGVFVLVGGLGIAGIGYGMSVKQGGYFSSSHVFIDNNTANVVTVKVNDAPTAIINPYCHFPVSVDFSSIMGFTSVIELISSNGSCKKVTIKKPECNFPIINIDQSNAYDYREATYGPN